MKPNKNHTVLVHIMFFFIFGVTPAAFFGMESEEFGAICSMILFLECVLWGLVILFIIAALSPDERPTPSGNVRQHPRKREIYDMPECERDPRRLGYITPDEIRRAARCRRRR